MQKIWPIWKKSFEHFTSTSGKLWLLASLNTWQRGVRILIKNPFWLSLLVGFSLISSLGAYSEKVITGFFGSMLSDVLFSSISFIISGLLIFFALAVLRPSIEPKTPEYFSKYLSFICTGAGLFIYWFLFSFYTPLFSSLISTATIISLFFLLDAPHEMHTFILVLKRMWAVVLYTFPMVFFLSLLAMLLELGLSIVSLFITAKLGSSVLFSFPIYLVFNFVLYGLCRPVLISLICCWQVKFKHEHPNLLFL